MTQEERQIKNDKRLAKQKERNDKIIADYNNGYDHGQLARKYKLSLKGISRMFMKEGVTTGIRADAKKYSDKHKVERSCQI